MPEYRVFGPPGTGKTTFLSRWILQTVQRHGSDSVMATSFTKAAATEIVGRHLPVDRSRIGTLHSFAYRAIGGGVIAEKKLIAEWNKSYPHYMLTDQSQSADDAFAQPVGATNEGDKLFSEAQKYRAQLIEDDAWNDEVLRFHQQWCAFKDETGSIDFQDMIEIALRDVDFPPVSCQYLFADECQDMTRAEIALTRKWGATCDQLVMAGDDDQAIYYFKGALADAFLTPDVPPEYKRLLGQSYRVPRQIVHYANQWIQGVKYREVKDYAPRDVEGELRWKPGIQYAMPTSILGGLEHDLAQTVTEEIDGKLVTRPATIMILATCAYMLDKIKYELRRQGIPFANRYRRYRGDWNPLHPSKGIGIAQRLLAYLGPYRRKQVWTAEELKWWGAMLKVDGVLLRGAKTQIAGLHGDRFVEPATLVQYFDREALDAAYYAAKAADPKWLMQHATVQYATSLEYPAKIVDRYGLDALKDEPQIVLGTIHSVKGAQADVVYCFPDVSPNGYREWDHKLSDAHDAMVRTFYVGFTRARESLVLCGPSSACAVRFPMKLPAPVPETI